MTDLLVQVTLLSVILGLVSYRLTKIVVEDDILKGWRAKHQIGIYGYRCGDSWYREWPEEMGHSAGCEQELSCEQAYQNAVRLALTLPWPMSWLDLLMQKEFWVRALSCGQCASVWVSGVLAAGCVLIMAAYSGQWLWLVLWPLLALAVAGIASRLLQL